MCYKNLEELSKEDIGLNERISYQVPRLEELDVSESVLSGDTQQILESQGGIYDS